MVLLSAWEVIRKIDEFGRWRITRLGKMLFIFAVLLFALSYVNKSVTKKEKVASESKQKHTEDSTRQADQQFYKNAVNDALQKYGLQLKPGTDTIKIVDRSQIKPIDPVMNIVADSVKFKRVKVRDPKDTVAIDFEYKLINDGIAYHLSNFILAFKLRGDSLIALTNSKTFENSTMVAQGNQGAYAMISGFVSNAAKIVDNDTTFFFFKATYTNKAVNGEKQPAIKSLVYSILPKRINSIKELSVHPVDLSSQYEYVKKILIKNKYW